MEYHNPTLRVLRILELIDSNPNGLNLSEIADLLELPKGTISPILKTLSAKKYVDLEGMLYKIGPRLFQLGLSFASGTNALSLIRKEMHNIVTAVEEVCQMGVLSGTDVHRLFRPTSFYFLSFPHSSRSLNTNHSFRRIRHTRALFPLLRFFLLYK